MTNEQKKWLDHAADRLERSTDGYDRVIARHLRAIEADLSASIADTAGAKPVACPECGGGPVTWKCLCEPMWRPAPPAPSRDTAGAKPVEKAVAFVNGFNIVWMSGTNASDYDGALLYAAPFLAAPPAPSVADDPTVPLETVISEFEAKHGPIPKVSASSGAYAAGAILPENVDWARVMTLAEKHGDGWSEAKGWSFHCDDDLFNFAGELAKESGND